MPSLLEENGSRASRRSTTNPLLARLLLKARKTHALFQQAARSCHNSGLLTLVFPWIGLVSVCLPPYDPAGFLSWFIAIFRSFQP